MAVCIDRFHAYTINPSVLKRLHVNIINPSELITSVVHLGFELRCCIIELLNDVSVAFPLLVCHLKLLFLPLFSKGFYDADLNLIELLIDLLFEVFKSLHEGVFVVTHDGVVDEILGIAIFVVFKDFINVFICLHPAQKTVSLGDACLFQVLTECRHFDPHFLEELLGEVLHVRNDLAGLRNESIGQDLQSLLKINLDVHEITLEQINHD